VPDFTAAWLALREPSDHAARSPHVTRAVACALKRNAELCVLDLGAGTGSNLRYLAGRLPTPQRWMLVDRQAALLAHAARADGPGVAVETRRLDIGRIRNKSVRSLFDGKSLVTASALLDLVSERWLREVAGLCADAGAAALFALTYDGRVDCMPADEGDELVVRLVNEHQRRDKGLGGRALGPDAADCAADAFAACGYRVQRGRSDWMLRADASELQRQLIDGWAFAATEVAPARATEIDLWRARRLEHVTAGRSAIRVGHEDLGAWNGEAFDQFPQCRSAKALAERRNSRRSFRSAKAFTLHASERRTRPRSQA